MKTLTLVIPSFNSAAYLHRCLDSLPLSERDVEVIVVDDGSTDATADVALGYAARYPGVVSVISKPNGGHGSAINTGLSRATGEYLRVVDSDDWLNASAASALLRELRRQAAGADPVDLLVTNYVYEKDAKRRKHVVRYTRSLPVNRTVTWAEIGQFGAGAGLLMHSLTYRTEVLRRSGLRLPEHTFYVDNLYAFIPLAHVRTMRYLNVDLYRYYIGREDQSVQEATMIRRLDQQLRVNRIMIASLPERDEVPLPLYHYLIHYLGLICGVSSVLLLKTGNVEAKEQLWEDLRLADPVAYSRLRGTALGRILHLPGRAGRRTSLVAYSAARTVIGFN
ncbi:MAG TPA: glycosyltransferase [Arachnia sp.]|nr:glycosyltransferase [Arachnia sp.]HMT86147.1 glycosyltransferase [Arachnia sp.]